MTYVLATSGTGTPASAGSAPSVGSSTRASAASRSRPRTRRRTRRPLCPWQAPRTRPCSDPDPDPSVSEPAESLSRQRSQTLNLSCMALNAGTQWDQVSHAWQLRLNGDDWICRFSCDANASTRRHDSAMCSTTFGRRTAGRRTDAGQHGAPPGLPPLPARPLQVRRILPLPPRVDAGAALVRFTILTLKVAAIPISHLISKIDADADVEF